MFGEANLLYNNQWFNKKITLNVFNKYICNLWLNEIFFICFLNVYKTYN